MGVGRLGGAVATGALSVGAEALPPAPMIGSRRLILSRIPIVIPPEALTLTGVGPLPIPLFGLYSVLHQLKSVFLCPLPSPVVHSLPLGGRFGSPFSISMPIHSALIRFFRDC